MVFLCLQEVGEEGKGCGDVCNDQCFCTTCMFAVYSVDAQKMFKETFFPSLARPPSHGQLQYTVQITERTSKAYLI